MAELEAQKFAYGSRAQRSAISKLLHTVREMLRWAKSCAGYIDTPADLGLSAPADVEGEL